MPPADLDLIKLHAFAVALARSMKGEPDVRRFVDGISAHLREMIQHDRLLLLPTGSRPVPSVPDVERTDFGDTLYGLVPDRMSGYTLQVSVSKDSGALAGPASPPSGRQ